jgi:hypothetical protein
MTEKERFDATMKKILSVSKQELQRRMEVEKAAKGSRVSTKLKTIDRRDTR